jgi:iron complex outermembrane receptor protein
LAQLGVRGERVRTDAGPVQGYDNGLGATWGNEAAAFNASARRRSDDNLDATVLLRWQPAPDLSWEAGWARKSHSPNLYQRYPWSTQPMAALMNNFVGDGNGYIGQPDLRPEVAQTLALGGDWHDAAEDRFGLKASLYLTRVHDFIDARRCDFGQCSAANVGATTGFVLLQYQNAEARLWGLDLSGHARLWADETLGRIAGRFVLGLARGTNLDRGDPLYNQMPPNLRLVLQQAAGGWKGEAELVAVAAKDRVSQVRNEMTTAGYALVNLRASYEVAHARLDVGVDNLADRFYTPPLGGAYLGQGPSMTSAGIAWGVPVPGMGRSFNLALHVTY